MKVSVEHKVCICIVRIDPMDDGLKKLNGLSNLEAADAGQMLLSVLNRSLKTIVRQALVAVFCYKRTMT